MGSFPTASYCFPLYAIVCGAMANRPSCSVGAFRKSELRFSSGDMQQKKTLNEVQNKCIWRCCNFLLNALREGASKLLSARRMARSKLHSDGIIRRHVTKFSLTRDLTTVNCTSLYKRLHTQVKSTVKLPPCLIQHCTMAHEETDVYHHVLNSVLDGGE
jgi:hypothetical protein